MFFDGKAHVFEGVGRLRNRAEVLHDDLSGTGSTTCFRLRDIVRVQGSRPRLSKKDPCLPAQRGHFGSGTDVRTGGEHNTRVVRGSGHALSEVSISGSAGADKKRDRERISEAVSPAARLIPRNGPRQAPEIGSFDQCMALPTTFIVLSTPSAERQVPRSNMGPRWCS